MRGGDLELGMGVGMSTARPWLPVAPSAAPSAYPSFPETGRMGTAAGAVQTAS